MKIVATVTDCAAAVYVGGHAESVSAIIEIPDDRLPDIVKAYSKRRRQQKTGEIEYSYQDLSFSLLDEPDDQ